MNIPTKVRIGNLDYNIKLSSDISMSEHCGKGAMFKQSIILNDEMSQDLKEETLFHEFIHQILSQKSFFDENKNEILIDTIASGMYQILKDNNLLVK